MSLLAETSTLTGDTASAAILYRALAPWEAFNAADVAEGVRGSIARYLGDLAAALDRRDEAVRHYEAALASNGRWVPAPGSPRPNRPTNISYSHTATRTISAAAVSFWTRLS